MWFCKIHLEKTSSFVSNYSETFPYPSLKLFHFRYSDHCGYELQFYWELFFILHARDKLNIILQSLCVHFRVCFVQKDARKPLMFKEVFIVLCHIYKSKHSHTHRHTNHLKTHTRINEFMYVNTAWNTWGHNSGPEMHAHVRICVMYTRIFCPRDKRDG